eukprot:gene6262-12679_t
MSAMRKGQTLGFGISQSKTPQEKNAVKNVTSWVASLLPDNSKEDSVQVMVTEVQCNEPDCVPIETLIILNGVKGKWMTKILKPVLEVSETDVKALLIPSDWALHIREVEDKKSASVVTAETVSPQLPFEDNDSVPAEMIWFHESLTEIKSRLATLSKSQQNFAIQYMEQFCQTHKSQLINSDADKKTDNIKAIEVTKETVVPMQPRPQVTSQPDRGRPIVVSVRDSGPPIRHNKGVRQRGCPCCDPDNIDNIVDRMLFLDAPP